MATVQRYRVEVTADAPEEGQDRRVFFGATCQLDDYAVRRLVRFIEQGLIPSPLTEQPAEQLTSKESASA